MIFYILSIKHNSKIALLVGWKISFWYLVVTFLRVRCHRHISTADLPANTQSNFIIMLNTQYVAYLNFMFIIYFI